MYFKLSRRTAFLFLLVSLIKIVSSFPIHKRNIGRDWRDKWLMYSSQNFYCTAQNRVVVVNPEDGNYRSRRWRKRGLAEALGFGPEHGKCDPSKATWVLLKGWNKPLPLTQARSQYPWIFYSNGTVAPGAIEFGVGPATAAEAGVPSLEPAGLPPSGGGDNVKGVQVTVPLPVGSLGSPQVIRGQTIMSPMPGAGMPTLPLLVGMPMTGGTMPSPAAALYPSMPVAPAGVAGSNPFGLAAGTSSIPATMPTRTK